MSKKQLKPAAIVPELNNWDEVNSSLKRLGELTVQKRELENKKTELISDITAKFDADAAPLLTEIEQINSSITNYVANHKDEFIKERTKDLSHGFISLRISTSVKVLSKAVCLKALKALGMGEFITIKEEPNKDMLKTLDDNQLAKCSCQKVVADNITIEPKIEEISKPGKEDA